MAVSAKEVVSKPVVNLELLAIVEEHLDKRIGELKPPQGSKVLVPWNGLIDPIDQNRLDHGTLRELERRYKKAEWMHVEANTVCFMCVAPVYKGVA